MDIARKACKLSPPELSPSLIPHTDAQSCISEMATRKRNEYLDIGSSDEENASGYDSEAVQESKGGRTAAPKARSSKRRRLNTGSSGSESDSNLAKTEAETTNDLRAQPNTEYEQSSPLPKDSANPPQEAPTTSELKSEPRPQHPTSLSASNKKTHKRGVIYLSRIPPFMRPSTVRHLLSPHGTITRLFLTPEPPSTYTSRKRSGGNKKRSFIDGWIEFSRHHDAKICVEAINGQIVGGKKGGWYRDDVWNAKYLRGFGWEDLMESVRREEREREEKIRVGVAREGRERREFLRGVERGKVEKGRRRKKVEKEARRKGVNGADDMRTTEGEVKALPKQGFERRFKQNEVSVKEKDTAQSDEVKRVLSKIF